MTFCRSILAGFLFLFAASQAHAACAPFPKSDYLGSYTHEQVQGYVNKALGGDWTPYLVTLNDNLERLENLLRNGKGATLKVAGKSKPASPSEIAKHVYVSRQWLSVAECLAEENTMAALNNFSTAAGGNIAASATTPEQETQQPAARVTQVAAASSGKQSVLVELENEVANLGGKPIAVKITSVCERGVTVFRVVNIGDTWPNAGAFSMFRMDGPNRQLISARRMRLETGEAKTFRVSKKQNLTGVIGFAIEPSWYKRDFTIDADARC